MTEMVFKKVLLLFIISFIIYCPILVNNYIGDDNIIIGRNTFYKSWNNLTRLFKKGYISNPREIYFNHEASYDFGTGSVSYRPVSNFIYFFDVHFFNAQPLGSHLINLVIHSVNTGIVYLIVFGLFNSNIFAFFTALFFSLHPIQSEAVSVMSYRADILSAMFCFSSFYCWIKFKQGNYSQKWYGFKSLFLYFLGLFSKESVLPLPILIFLIDELIGTKAALRKRIGYYFIFLLIASGYLYIYFFVFKNISMHFYFIGGSLVSHVAMMGYICSKYLNCIFFPWTVKLIPGLYVPSTFDVEKGLPSLVLFLSILFCIYFILWNYFKVLFIFFELVLAFLFTRFKYYSYC